MNGCRASRHRVDNAVRSAQSGPAALFRGVAAGRIVLGMTDAAAVARAHEIFDPIVAEYLGRPGVDIGPMFGSEGVRIRGKVFAFVGHRGNLVVKVPAERADALEAAGDGERMHMRGRTMREWVVLDPDRADRWPAVTAEAFAYVDELTP